MFGDHRIRPRTVAKINSNETLLRSLGPLQAVALMPRFSLCEAAGLGLKAIRLEGSDLDLKIGR
jgi:hypothetical protein